MTEEHRVPAGTLSRFAFPYVQYLPDDYDPASGKTWPLLIFLHGAGERGEDLTAVYRHGPPCQLQRGKSLPFVMIAPQCPDNRYWACYTESLNALLDGVLATLAVDPDRVYLTGLSMGGTGTWMWSMANPERFAAIVPVCGTGVYWNAGMLQHVPVWAFHGDADDIVLPEESSRMVQHVNEFGGNARLTLYPGVGHDSWYGAYGDPALYPWLLSHTRYRKDAQA